MFGKTGLEKLKGARSQQMKIICKF